MKRGDATKSAILDAGLTLARDGGLSAVTLRSVGEAIGRAHTGVAYYFGDQDGLRHAVANRAVELGDARIIARLIIDRHPSCAGMSRQARLSFLASVAD